MLLIISIVYFIFAVKISTQAYYRKLKTSDKEENKKTTEFRIWYPWIFRLETSELFWDPFFLSDSSSPVITCGSSPLDDLTCLCLLVHAPAVTATVIWRAMDKACGCPSGLPPSISPLLQMHFLALPLFIVPPHE